MAKRSPILGYNHNVRYRGLVFHVQTEDSGILAPHLFTHLFHSGVIVSTRKYVYDSGSTEEAIKSLMQAQHKAAMKELRRGVFDDKIDQYLGGTPGLLPRGVVGEAEAVPGEAAPADGAQGEAVQAKPAAAEAAPAKPVAAAEAAQARPAAAEGAQAKPAAAEAAPAKPAAAEGAPAKPAAAEAAPAKPAAAEGAQAKPAAAAQVKIVPADPARPAPRPARFTRSGLRAFDGAEGAEDEPLERTVLDGEIAISRERTLEDPAIGLRPTEQDFRPLSIETERDFKPLSAAEMGLEDSMSGVMPPDLPPDLSPVTTQMPVPAVELELAALGQDAGPSPEESQPEILIQLEVDDDEDELPPPRAADLAAGLPPRRRPHDSETGWDMTQIDLAPMSDGIPGGSPGSVTGPVTLRNAGDLSGPAFSPGLTPGPLSQRAAKAVGAASLPPARPILRPASRAGMVPPQVVIRPLPTEDRRTPPPPADDRRTPTPAPVDADAPPPVEAAGQAPERPGQYSAHNKISTRIPPGDTMPERLRPLGPQQGSLARPGAAPLPQGRAGTVQGQGVPQPQPLQRSSPVAIPQPQPLQRSSPVAIPQPQPLQRSGPVAIPQPITGQRSTPVTIPIPGRGQQPPPQFPQMSRPSTPSPVPLQSRPSVPLQPGRPTPMPGPAARPSERPRTPTPQRVSMSPSAAAGLAPGRGGAPSSSGGVVMTRPAVIVGAPAKPAAPSQRVRKAREDEGRGFGQGLISEKSLDEVILAYLSEDAEDK